MLKKMAFIAHVQKVALVGLLGPLFLAPASCTRSPARPEVQPPSPPQLLSGSHQLSFEGRQSGEGHFSRDNRQLIFQSEREPGNPFYQVYTLNLESGMSQLVSPGVGKSTDGFFHPGGRLALFSSNYLAHESVPQQREELDPGDKDPAHPFDGDHDENYDIFSTALDRPDDRTPRRLTRERGYDGEAAWSPNGREIVFASNRHAYGASAGAEPQPLPHDPSASIDLYLMDASGRNVQRLTEAPGYDGDPSFSPDGERIVWRRFSPDGKRSEIHAMNKDGTDLIQITRLDGVSSAPFYHPSGEYIIFSANLDGPDDFDLYMVDARGEKKPLPVTNASGFNSLPAFSPDGNELIWTSNQTTSGRPQLFRAHWDDALARSMLGLPASHGPATRSLLPLPQDLDDRIHEDDLRAHVVALTDPVTNGRLTGTTGEKIASSYVARLFRSLGLEPAGDNGSYFQSFGFTAGISLGKGNRLEVLDVRTGKASLHEVGTDWLPFSFSKEGEMPPAEIVYGGYGVQAPEAEGQRAIDDYAGIDVTDRWVLVFRYLPEGLSPESRQHLHRYSSIRHKAMVAREQGARGLLVVSGPRSKVRNELVPLKFDVSLSGTSVAALTITDALAEELIEPSGWSLDELQSQTDSNSDTPGFLIPDRTLGAHVSLERQRKTGRNVLGRLQVGPSPSDQLIVLGAHLDHLGSGGGSSSLADEKDRNKVHPGADDNASGVAALLEIAQEQAKRLQEGRLPANRDILFAAWSGEELGLLGSNFWTMHAVNPHDSGATLSSRVLAYLNFDMVGRMQDSVSIYGVGSSSIWPREIEAANVSIGLAIQPHQESSLPTDATSFYNQQIPTLAAFTGAHTDYHTPTDTSEKLDYEGLRDIALLMSRISTSLAVRSDAPDFLESQGSARIAPRANLRAYLGTIPDYANSEVTGLLLSGVTKGGPADEAGLRGGDVIVELAGRKIENIYDYTFAIEALKIGETTSVTVNRSGNNVILSITPGSRE